MLQKAKRLVLQAGILGFILAPLAITGVIEAQAPPPPPPPNNLQTNVCQGSKLGFTDAPTETCAAATAEGETRINTLIIKLVNVFSIIVGIVAVVMIIYGGFRYITSGGDSGNVTSAKNTVLFAIVGLIIVAMAQFIVKFVLNKSTT